MARKVYKPELTATELRWVIFGLIEIEKREKANIRVFEFAGKKSQAKYRKGIVTRLGNLIDRLSKFEGEENDTNT